MKQINYLSFSNSKLKADNIYTFGIPAGQSKSGINTCPGKGTCATGCYAMQGFYVMPNVAKKQEERLALALQPSLFVSTINAEIERRKVTRVRIHDSGDFFSLGYFNSWLSIIQSNPNVTFYAYTKMVRFFKARESLMPKNFHVIYSEGGTQDALIDQQRDKHSRVFPSESALKRAKYSNAAHSDRPSIQGKQRIGLVYHGHNSKAWATA